MSTRHARFVIAPIAALLVLGMSGCGSSTSSSPTATPAKNTGSTSTTGLGLISPGVLTVGSDTTYPPMESSDPNNPGTYVGADVDLANALAKAMGLTGAKIAKGTFDSLIPSLEAKRYDVIMSSMNNTPARAQQVNFVNYMTASEGILVKSSSGIHANSYSALCGKTVAVERGTTEQDGLNAANKTCSAKITIQSYAADTDAYQAFNSGHSDAYSGDLPVAAQYAKASGGKYRLAGAAITSGEDYGIAIRKGDGTLKTAIQRALAKIRASGQYARVLKRWGVQGAALR